MPKFTGKSGGGPFKMRSGNKPLKFKNMGATPLKQTYFERMEKRWRKKDHPVQKGLSWFNKNLNPAMLVINALQPAADELKQGIYETQNEHKHHSHGTSTKSKKQIAQAEKNRTEGIQIKPGDKIKALTL